MQQFVDTITWLGAKRQGLVMFEGDEKKSTAHADRMVARAQGSGNFHERTNFERGTINKGVRNTETVRAWSLFLSYFAAKVNVAYERTKKVNIHKNPMELINYPVDMAMLFAVEGVLAAIIREGLPDDDDEALEKLAGMAVWEGVKSFAVAFGVRSIYPALNISVRWPKRLKPVDHASYAVYIKQHQASAR
jgi:hypothetical protein